MKIRAHPFEMLHLQVPLVTQLLSFQKIKSFNRDITRDSIYGIYMPRMSTCETNFGQIYYLTELLYFALYLFSQRSETEQFLPPPPQQKRPKIDLYLRPFSLCSVFSFHPAIFSAT